MQKNLKDFFIPHVGNDYVPHSLQKLSVFCMSILILLSFVFANLQSMMWITSDWLVSTILPAVIVDLTNNERSTYNLSDLSRNSTLDFAAQLKAQHMAENQYFAHFSPEGISPWHWFSVANYNFVHAGENLAIHFSDSDTVVDAWMNSPTHKANIVNNNFREIGIGTAKGVYEGYQTVYVVQLFGTPAAPVAAAPALDASVVPTVLAATEERITATATKEEGTSATPLIAASEEIIELVEDTEVVLSTDRDPIVAELSEEIAETDTIEEVVVHEDSVSVYSELISSSTAGVPASIDSSFDVTSQTTPSLYSIATKPQTVLQILYAAISFFVLLLLILSILIEIRRQHPIQIAYSAALLGVMGILLYAHTLVTSSVTIV